MAETPKPLTKKAYISGKVTQTIQDEGVIIETQGSFIQGIFGIGTETFGVLTELTPPSDGIITESHITDTHKGHILIGSQLMTYQAFQKAQDIGVNGIITGGIHYQDVTKILGYPIGVAITGSEPLKTTLIVTEGFGNIAMAQKTRDILTQHTGKIAAINGATQIRAGVQRPEIIIPHSDDRTPTKTFHETDLIVSIGSQVRIIREPYFGQRGTIKSLPKELHTVESETQVRIAEITLKNNQTIQVPRANLELILD